MRRALEDAAGGGDQRRPLGRVDRFHRRTLILQQQQVGLGAVGLQGALAERESLRRLERRLYLRDVLLGELLEIGPAEIARYLERCGENRAAVVGASLDDPALPFWIEQVGEALRRI